jgi:hypothetical protein
LTGLDIDEKAALVERALWSSIAGGKEAFDAVEVQLLRTDHEDPASNEAALAQLRIIVKSSDERAVGRALTSKVTEMALASYPGFFGGPSSSQAYGVFWPTTVPAGLVWQDVVILGPNDSMTSVDPVMAPPGGAAADPAHEPPAVRPEPDRSKELDLTERAPIGRVMGARSGDKGGNANLGVWARSDLGYLWLRSFLTTERLLELVPEAAALPAVERHELAGIRAINFVLVGLLGEGVASSPRVDAQAKGLGEYLRAKVVEVPVALLEQVRTGAIDR